MERRTVSKQVIACRSKEFNEFSSQSKKFQACWERTNRLQHALKDGRIDGDCILIILGIDGRFNSGSIALFDYLFPGFHEVLKLKRASRSRILADNDEDSVDDIVIGIRHDSCDVYCRPGAYHALLPYMAFWTNVNVYCCNSFEDTDESDDFKVKSFIAMMEGTSRVGLPYESDDLFDAMKVEKWPLIQAYALEDFGSNGFFTLNHKLVDITTACRVIKNEMDFLNLQLIIQKKLPRFSMQWDSMFSLLNSLSIENWRTLDATTCAEAFNTYYRHSVDGVAGVRLPDFVQFGKQSLSNHHSPSAEAAMLMTAGINKSPALHMVCHLQEGNGPLSCWRTYFLRGKENTADQRLLQELYYVFVDSANKTIKDIAEGLHDPNEVMEANREILSELITRTFSVNGDSLKVELQAVDVLGKSLAAIDSQQILQLKFTICDVPSTNDGGHALLGSVSFGESFVVCPHGATNEGSIAAFHVLTENIPVYSHWQIPSVVEDGKTEPCMAVQQEKKGSSSEAVLLLSTPTGSQIEWASVRCLPGEMRLERTNGETMTMRHRDIKTVNAFDDVASSPVALLRFVMKGADDDSSVPSLWYPKYREMLLAFPKVSAAFYNRMMVEWRSTVTVVRLPIADLSGPALKTYYEVQRIVNVCYELQGGRVGSQSNSNKDSQFEKFLNSYVTDSKGRDAGRQIKEHFAMPSEHAVLTISLLVGLPNSGMHSLCKKISSQADRSERLSILQCNMDPERNIAELKETVDVEVRNLLLWAEEGSEKGIHKLLVAVEGFYPIVEVVTAIDDMTKQWNQRACLGSVTACMDVSLFDDNSSNLLNVALKQCVPGYTKSVVISSVRHQQKGMTTNDATTLMTSVHPSFHIVRYQSNTMLDEKDISVILSSTQFFSDGQTSVRKAFSSLRSDVVTSNLLHVSIPLRKPLNRAALNSKVSAACDGRDVTRGVSVVCICGRATFENSSSRYTFMAFGGKTIITQCTASDQKPSHCQDDCYAVAIGRNIDKESLGCLIEECMIRDGQPKKLTVEDLSKAKKQEIESKHKLDVLPEGWFFSGTRYVCLDGQQKMQHPNLNRFFEEYVAQINTGLH